MLAPKDTRFYDLFEQVAANLVIVADKLVDLFHNYQDVQAKARELKNLEHEGDTLTHQIIQRLHSTFVTPLDREDIALLAHGLDDVMDFIEAAGRTAFLYRVTQPTERSRQLTLIVAKIAYKLREVLPRLRRRDQFPLILQACIEMNSLENEADDVQHAALAELFDNAMAPSDIIKWREIYEHLENATDRGEDVANILEGIVLKNA